MKFRLQGKLYTMAAIDRLTLLDLMKLERQTEEMGRPMKWSELRSILEHFDTQFDVDGFDPEGDDLYPWFLGLLIWATRRDAGDEVTFGDAVDVPLGEIEIVVDEPKRKAPQDRRHKKTKGGVEGPDPRRARAASARAAAPLPSPAAPASP